MNDKGNLHDAVPTHLRTKRTRNARVSENFVPASAAFTARFDPNQSEIVVAYLGIQAHTQQIEQFENAKQQVLNHLKGTNGPQHWDWGSQIDRSDLSSYVFSAYWNRASDFEKWRTGRAFSAWWDNDKRLDEGVGYFLEVFRMKHDRMETIFGDYTPKGCAHLAHSIDGPIREHGYWGSARDRLAISQTDFIEPGPLNTIRNTPDTTKRRIKVKPHENLCLIRFGQDLTNATKHECELFDTMIRPPLLDAMEFLDLKGEHVGCLSNRFIDLVSSDAKNGTASYSVSLWQSLDHLERWTESHPTHLTIFLNAMKYFKTLKGQHKLQIFHEMSVLQTDDQSAEYINCLPGTGLLITDLVE